ncbi:type 2 lanthipeptide synthetase LanM [Roseovarius indicus]|nr:type 2 lanthipeptide synthetase LanM [Roseovarius indicus]
MQSIAAGALSLEERWAFPGSTRRPCDAETLANWYEALNGAMPQRLHLAGQEGTDPADLLFEIDPAGIDPLPAWVVALNSALCDLGSSAERRVVAPPGSPSLSPEPFEELLWPLARTLADDWTAEQKRLLSEVARFQARHALLRRLARQTERSLGVVFANYRASHTEAGAYGRFIALMRQGGFGQYLLAYPVAARAIMRTVDNWHSALQEMIERLARDQSALKRLTGTSAIFPIRDIDFELSDPHDGERSVARLTLAAGKSVHYKPRPIEAEHVLASVARKFEDFDPARFSLPCPAMIARPDCGWVETITQTDLPEDVPPSLYFRRFGHWLGLMHVLQGGDIHPDNVVACGAHPHIVDAEVLLQGVLSENNFFIDAARDPALRALSYSTIHTGMLPSFAVKEDGQTTDQSGWYLPQANDLNRLRQRWAEINSDDMHLADETGPRATHHLPTIGGRQVGAREHAADIVVGLREILEASLDLRDPVAVELDRLMASGTIATRFVFRDTQVYGAMLDRLADPPAQRSGLARSIRLETLARVLKSPKTGSVVPALLRSELTALERGDVPLFRTFVASGEILSRRQVIVTNAFGPTGVQWVKTRLAALAPASIAREADIVSSAYMATHDKSPAPPRDSGGSANFRELAVPEMERLTTLLSRTALQDDGDALNWLAIQPVGTEGRTHVAPLDTSLYDGLAGIALALAVSADVTRSRMAATLCEGSLKTIAHKLSAGDLAEVGPGYGEGVGGVLAASAQIASLFPNMIARQVIDQIATALERGQELETWDVEDLYGGIAGLILGLGAVEPVLGRARTAVLMKRAFKRLKLLLARPQSDTTGRAWGSGMAHGAGGIAAAQAMLQSFGVLGPHENLPESGESGAPASTDDEKPARATSWCHGAGGLALDTSILQRAAGCGPDHLCCGEAGRLDSRLALGDDVEPLRREAAGMVSAAQGSVGYRFYLRGPDTLKPGLFTGHAGIIYLLARLHDPDRYDSILPRMTLTRAPRPKKEIA